MLSFGELGKALGAGWKALEEDDKIPYQKEAAEDKERYLKEKAEWEAKQAEGNDESDEEAAVEDEDDE